MSNNCNNCDHKNVCVNCDFTSDNFKCPYWNGWHNAKEEPPKEGDDVFTLHKIRGKFCYTVCNFHDGNFEDGINPPGIMNKTVVAWRELPEYEV